ncbi:hypothetical protein [Streptomyces sp. NPDC058418]|uniref:hypothetical protein n=1 Tax=Streptomyces sp. NPDC058418 TaxID=3346488 RepID=UPI0036673FEA
MQHVLSFFFALTPYTILGPKAFSAYPATATRTSQRARRGGFRDQRNALGAGLTDLSRGLLLVDGAEFDRDPDLITAENGVIDLRTGAPCPPGPHPAWCAADHAVGEHARGP